jgi:hypothetical protein
VERVRARPEVRPAVLEDGLLDAPWEWLRHSNSLVEPLFNDDREAAAGSNYWGSFVRRQGPVVLDQLARSAQHTAQLVLLAWHLAGRPSPPATVGDVPDESTYGGLDRR